MTNPILGPDGAIDLWLHDGCDPPYPEVALDAGEGGVLLWNVTRPTLTPFLPDAGMATGTGVIVAPGGAFRALAWDHEGTLVCEWLRARGIAAFLLKYRLAPTGPTVADLEKAMQDLMAAAFAAGSVKRCIDGIGPTSGEDGLRALEVVRENADEWGLQDGRLGMLGFSAGGYVATVAGLAPAARRADFFAAIYPVVPEVLEVAPDAPPLFTVVAADDPICFDETISLYTAFVRAGRPAEMHCYPTGGHGFGVRRIGDTVDGWIDRFHEWLRARSLV